MRVHVLFCAVLVLSLLGCGGTSTDSGSPKAGIVSSTNGSAEDEVVGTADIVVEPQESEAVAGADADPGQPAEENPVVEAAPIEEPATPPAEPGTERVKAEKGVGLKGRSLDEHEGMLVTPAKAYFSARERIIFDIQVPKALQLYEATSGSPRTHEEFMTQIIDAQRIKLPELPPGQRYIYDPETKELMVERPAR